MTAIVTQPSAGAAAQQHYADTIDTPVSLADHASVLGPVLDDLLSIFSTGEAPMWGVTPGNNSVNVGKYERAGGG